MKLLVIEDKKRKRQAYFYVNILTGGVVRVRKNKKNES